MSDETFDLYLIQNPSKAWPEDDNARVFNEDALRYFKGSIAIKNIKEFAGRVISECTMRRKKIRKLVIGPHGDGAPSCGGNFYIDEGQFLQIRSKGDRNLQDAQSVPR